MTADWCALPDEILGEMMLKLGSAEDIIYFSAVCRSWLCVYSMVKKGVYCENAMVDATREHERKP